MLIASVQARVAFAPGPSRAVIAEHAATLLPDMAEFDVGGAYRVYRPSFTPALRTGAFADFLNSGFNTVNWFQIDGATSFNGDATEVVISIVVRLH